MKTPLLSKIESRDYCRIFLRLHQVLLSFCPRQHNLSHFTLREQQRNILIILHSTNQPQA